MTNPGRTTTVALGAALVLTALTSAPSTALASGGPTAPPPESVTVTLQGNNGSGCPRERPAEFSVNPQTHAFTIRQIGFDAEAGGDADRLAFRRNCQSGIRVTAPPEFTYALSYGDYFGYADLQPGASGLLNVSYYFQGDPGTTSYRHVIKGPVADYWQYTDTVDIAALRFLPCGERRNLNINSELRVDLGASDKSQESVIGMGPTRASTYQLVWKRCPRSGLH
ncbi:DUF4360 domain-containing protein [Actinomadura roseirufa]|uniref:DUF4360 domain-containing protein n=1 Tax=Actinomadura roseirufa TaxID=2094049 RepID=UPI00104197D3|nr:DUF4360 domain-containing protein [Actinomadura roseirufa]